MAAYAKALFLAVSGHLSEAKTITEAALRRNPNLAPLYVPLSIVQTGLGDYEQAKSDIEQARRLSPREPQIGIWEFQYGRAELGLGHYAEAIEAEHRAVDDVFRTYSPHEVLAAAYALSGKDQEAKAELAETMSVNPGISSMRSLSTIDSEDTAAARRPAQGRDARGVSETRKIAAILVADVVGYSRLAGADEDRTLSRLRGLRSDLIDPAIAAHNGRIVKRTGDGSLIEFRSVVDAVRCAIEVQNGMVERNAGLPPERRIEFRVGIHLGDVVEESDGDLMGDGVNIAARLDGICEPGGICLSEQAYWQVKGRLDLGVTDLGPTQLKNIAEPIRVYALQVGVLAEAKSTKPVEADAPKKRSPLTPLVAGFSASPGPGANIHRPPLPCRRSERQSGFPEAARKGHQRHAQGWTPGGMSETRKLAAILVADVVGYSRRARTRIASSRGCARCAAI